MLTKVIDNHPYLKVRYIENPDPRANAEDWFVARRDDSIQAEVSLVRTHKLDQDSLIRPYDLLGNENLYRAVLYEVDEGAPYLFWDFHHIIYDQESLLVLAEDVKRLMEGRPLIPEDVSGYETALEERWRKDGEKEEIAAYFRELLKDCDKDINSWIYDRTDPYTLFKSGRTFDEQKGFACMIGSRIISVRESSVPMQQVRSRCADLNITENMFFTAIFACLLGELNGRSKALFATVVNNRDYDRLKHTVTMLCRTVPVYLKVTQDELTSPHFLKQLRHVMSNAGRASILSYEDICRMNGISLPRITVIYYDKPVDRELIPGCRRVSLNTLDTIDTLMLKVYYDSRDTLFFRLDTSLDFTKQEVDFMAGRLEELIRRI
jgi:surfactin family lipopeptide synthetase A